MAKYLVVKVSHGNSEVTYYRKQTVDHPTHGETNQFSKDAIATHARAQGVQPSDCRSSGYRSNQPQPIGTKI